jgi:hypothetical protein
VAEDPSLAVRQAMVAALEDAAAVTAIVPAGRIHAAQPPADPVRPFVRCGVTAAQPFRASGLDGARLTVTVDGFADGPQEDAVATLGAAIAATLDGRVLALGQAAAHVGWTGSRLRRDGDEAGAHHVAVGFDVVVT